MIDSGENSELDGTYASFDDMKFIRPLKVNDVEVQHIVLIGNRKTFNPLTGEVLSYFYIYYFRRGVLRPEIKIFKLQNKFPHLDFYGSMIYSPSFHCSYTPQSGEKILEIDLILTNNYEFENVYIDISDKTHTVICGPSKNNFVSKEKLGYYRPGGYFLYLPFLRVAGRPEVSPYDFKT